MAKFETKGLDDAVKGLKGDLDRAITEEIASMEFDVECPYCGEEITIPAGKHPCPKCAGEIDHSVNVR